MRALKLTARAWSHRLKVLIWSAKADRGGLLAETYLSTQSAPSSQDARIPYPDENGRGTQGIGGAPQEGTP
jgi:hypothetical protein